MINEYLVKDNRVITNDSAKGLVKQENPSSNIEKIIKTSNEIELTKTTLENTREDLANYPIKYAGEKVLRGIVSPIILLLLGFVTISLEISTETLLLSGISLLSSGALALNTYKKYKRQLKMREALNLQIAYLEETLTNQKEKLAELNLNQERTAKETNGMKSLKDYNQERKKLLIRKLSALETYVVENRKNVSNGLAVLELSFENDEEKNLVRKLVSSEK